MLSRYWTNARKRFDKNELSRILGFGGTNKQNEQTLNVIGQFTRCHECLHQYDLRLLSGHMPPVDPLRGG